MDDKLTKLPLLYTNILVEKFGNNKIKPTNQDLVDVPKVRNRGSKTSKCFFTSGKIYGVTMLNTAINKYREATPHHVITCLRKQNCERNCLFL